MARTFSRIVKSVKHFTGWVSKDFVLGGPGKRMPTRTRGETAGVRPCWYACRYTCIGRLVRRRGSRSGLFCTFCTRGFVSLHRPFYWRDVYRLSVLATRGLLKDHRVMASACLLSDLESGHRLGRYDSARLRRRGRETYSAYCRERSGRRYRIEWTFS